MFEEKCQGHNLQKAVVKVMKHFGDPTFFNAFDLHCIPLLMHICIALVRKVSMTKDMKSFDDTVFSFLTPTAPHF